MHLHLTLSATELSRPEFVIDLAPFMDSVPLAVPQQYHDSA